MFDTGLDTRYDFVAHCIYHVDTFMPVYNVFLYTALGLLKLVVVGPCYLL